MASPALTFKVVVVAVVAIAATAVVSIVRHSRPPDSEAAPAAPAAPRPVGERPPAPADAVPSRAADPDAAESACTVAKGPSPIADACREGGRAAAKKAMKEILNRARGQGIRKACDNCHVDVDDFALLADARTDLQALLRQLER